jgi:ankyrin repeat protein
VALIENGADVNEPLDFCSVLGCAVARGHANIVDLLLRSGADVNAVNKLGWSALMFAAYFGEEGIARILLEAGANPSLRTMDTGKTAFILAAERNHPQVIRTIVVEEDADVNTCDNHGWTALLYVCKCSNDEVDAVTALLNRGACIDVSSRYGWTALMRAAEANNPGILDVLIQKGADVNRQNGWESTALMLASYDASPRIVKRLLEAGASVEFEGAQKSALVMACRSAHQRGATEVIKALLEHGADTEQTDEYGKTPLMMVCDNEARLFKHPHAFAGSRAEYIKQARLLVAHGADVHAKDPKDDSSVRIASDVMQQVLNEPLFTTFRLASTLARRPDSSREHRLMDQISDLLPLISRMTSRIP